MSDEVAKTIIFTGLGAITAVAAFAIGYALAYSTPFRLLAVVLLLGMCSYAFGVGIRALVGA